MQMKDETLILLARTGAFFRYNSVYVYAFKEFNKNKIVFIR